MSTLNYSSKSGANHVTHYSDFCYTISIDFRLCASLKSRETHLLLLLLLLLLLGELLGPREIRIGSGESSTMRNFILCTVT